MSNLTERPVNAAANLYTARATALVQEAAAQIEAEAQVFTTALDPAARYCKSTQIAPIFFDLRKLKREAACAAFLTADGHLLDRTVISMGDLTQCIMIPRAIFKRALLLNAEGVVIAHNHPDTGAEPSTADERCYLGSDLMGKFLGVRVLDALVIGKEDWTSIPRFMSQQPGRRRMPDSHEALDFLLTGGELQ